MKLKMKGKLTRIGLWGLYMLFLFLAALWIFGCGYATLYWIKRDEPWSWGVALFFTIVGIVQFGYLLKLSSLYSDSKKRKNDTSNSK
jgi:hypothetical protein